MVLCPYTYFTQSSTTSHLFPDLVLFAPSAPYYPTEHYVAPRLIIHLVIATELHSFHHIALQCCRDEVIFTNVFVWII